MKKLFQTFGCVNNRPIMDSYDGIYCNWCWGGSYDGYYHRGQFNPGSFDFTNKQKMMFPSI